MSLPWLGLNPCCYGIEIEQWLWYVVCSLAASLNPCCYGIEIERHLRHRGIHVSRVLILVVME